MADPNTTTNQSYKKQLLRKIEIAYYLDTMDDQEKADYELQSQKLRTELKQWENEWAKTSGGKKPSREDIKQNRDIGVYLDDSMQCFLSLTEIASQEIQRI